MKTRRIRTIEQLIQTLPTDEVSVWEDELDVHLNRAVLIVRAMQPHTDWANSFDDGGPTLDLAPLPPKCIPTTMERGREWR